MNMTYGNEIELAYILDSEEIIIKSECISFVILDYQYDKNNMPLIYISLNINVALYDSILANINKGLFRFTLYRYNTSSKHSLKTKSINGLFTYLIPTDVDYNKSASDNNSFKSGTMALISLDNINDNKQLYNDIIKDSNMISIIHKYTNHISMIIEPMENADLINQLIIPPTSTLTKLISFLNSEQHFYKTPYRLFRDFDKTYLLSSSGLAVPEDSSPSYDSIIINVVDINEESVSTGMEMDPNKKLIIMNVNAQDTSMDININEDLHFNTIIGYDMYGNVKKKTINTQHNSDNDRYLLRYFDYVDDDLNHLAKTVDDTSIILNIIKSEINPTFLTLNKEYLVYNYPAYRQYDGKYLLSYKKEMMLQQDGEFISSVVFGLRKVME